MQKLKQVINDIGIITRKSVVALEIKLDDSILALIYNLSSVVDVHSGDTFKIIMLNGYAEIIIDEDKLADVTKLIPKGYIQALRPGLCEMTFLLGKKVNSQEIFKEIYSELIDNDIDVVQTVSNSAGHTILIDKNDFVKASRLINSVS